MRWSSPIAGVPEGRRLRAELPDATLQAPAAVFGPIEVRRDEDVFGFSMSGAITPQISAARMWFDALCQTAFDERDTPPDSAQYISALPGGRASILQSIGEVNPVDRIGGFRTLFQERPCTERLLE